MTTGHASIDNLLARKAAQEFEPIKKILPNYYDLILVRDEAEPANLDREQGVNGTILEGAAAFIFYTKWNDAWNKYRDEAPIVAERIFADGRRESIEKRLAFEIHELWCQDDENIYHLPEWVERYGLGGKEDYDDYRHPDQR